MFFKTDNDVILWRDLIEEIPPIMAGGREHPANLFDIARKALETGDPRQFAFRLLPSDAGMQAFFNDAPGMSPAKFEWFMLNLSAQDPDKPQGGLLNYGIGVRTAALKASPDGVTVYTKAAGVTLRGRFAKQGGGYGPVELPDGTLFEAVPGFPAWLAERLGSDPQEGTLTIHEGNAMGGVSSKGGPAWAMSRRWWSIPPNVTVVADKSLAAGNNGWTMVPLSEIVRPRKGSEMVKTGEHEIVTLPGGVRLHFAFLSAAGSGGKRQVGWAEYRRAFGGLVYRGEVYDFREGSDWTYATDHMGLSAIADRVTVFVEIPESYPVGIVKLRDMLKFRSGASHGEDGAVATLRSFSRVIKENLPQWVRDAVAAELATRSAKLTADQKQRLADLFRQMKLDRPGVTPDPAGTEGYDDAMGGTLNQPVGQKSTQTQSPHHGAVPGKVPQPSSAQKGRLGVGAMPPFRLIFAIKDEQVNGRQRFFLWMTDSSGLVDGMDLVWNSLSTLHLQLVDEAAAIAAEFVIDWTPQVARQTLETVLTAAIMDTVGPAYVQMHFNGVYGGWPDEDIDHVKSPATLSLLIGNQIEFRAMVRAGIRAALKHLPKTVATAA